MRTALRCPATSRSGFTLLEVLLASVIAVLLMAALYTAMEVQLRYADAGRQLVDDVTLSRQILARIAADLNAALTPITAVPAATSTTGSTTGTTGTTGTGTTTTDPAAVDPNAPTNAATTSGVTPFNCGLIGEATMVSLWVSKLPQPRGPVDPNVDAQETGGVSDIRRVTYWFDGEKGLLKQTLTSVTADSEQTALPPPVDGADQIAHEVTSLLFEYFDGTSWTDTWDGTVLGADAATPIGPPRAIRISIDIRHKGKDEVKRYSRVVAIHSANAQPVVDPTATGGGGN